jgi:NADPH:quinone reductase-like Zn-dependent oxidoreductase
LLLHFKEICHFLGKPSSHLHRRSFSNKMAATMKAIFFSFYGAPKEVLELKQVEIPVPTKTQVRIKICASSVNAADWHLIRADPWLARLGTGLFRPTAFQIPGADVAGVVECLGNDVKKFKVNDRVFGDLSGKKFGAFAEYVCVEEDVLISMPENISMEQSAATPMAAMTALKGLVEIGKLKETDNVLVLGSSGGVGSFAVQIAKAFNAKHVTAVCHSSKVEMCRSIGADVVIDYTVTDVTKQTDVKYDLIVDFAGYRPAKLYSSILSPNGTYVFGGGSTSELFSVMLKGGWIGTKGQSFKSYLSMANEKDLKTVTELLGEGKIKPFIKDRFPLERVADAITFLQDRKSQGKVVITISE